MSSTFRSALLSTRTLHASTFPKRAAFINAVCFHCFFNLFNCFFFFATIHCTRALGEPNKKKTVSRSLQKKKKPCFGHSRQFLHGEETSKFPCSDTEQQASMTSRRSVLMLYILFLLSPSFYFVEKKKKRSKKHCLEKKKRKK